jgi:NADPH2:quinone reductase
VRAVVCTSLTGEDGIEVRDDWPEPGPCAPAQVRIAMQAVSVNFPDTLITRGLYQFRPDPPFVVGNEGAGVVAETGADVMGLSVGDRVLTLTGTAAFAESVVATPPAQQVHRIPDEMPWDQAAAFNLTYGTAAHGLVQRGSVQPGETVLVTGAAGGCGSAAIQVARALGARVVAVAGGAVKAALVHELGADEVIDHRELGGEDRALSTRVRELTGGRGVDVVFDNVGAPEGSDDVRDLVRCLAWNGRYLVVGFAGGGIPRVALNQTILRSISFVGVAYGATAIADPDSNRELFARLFDWYREGKVTPHIGHRFPLDRAADAIRTMSDRGALGKIVISLER